MSKIRIQETETKSIWPQSDSEIKVQSATVLFDGVVLITAFLLKAEGILLGPDACSPTHPSKAPKVPPNF